MLCKESNIIQLRLFTAVMGTLNLKEIAERDRTEHLVEKLT